MTASVQSPEDLVNVALVRIGYAPLIANLYEGTRAANAALDIYAETRDALLRAFPWGFAEQILVASPTGLAPPFPWTVAYLYPSNCVAVRDVIPPGYAADENNPLPVLWTVANDPVEGRVIWSKITGAIVVFTAQVTNPALWDTLFVDALANEVGKKLALSLASQDSLKSEMENEKVLMPLAEGVVG